MFFLSKYELICLFYNIDREIEKTLIIRFLIYPYNVELIFNLNLSAYSFGLLKQFRRILF